MWNSFGLWLIALRCIMAQEPDELRFMVLGDWGEYLLDAQSEVRDQMSVWAELNSPDFVLSTGDNFYPWGIDSPDDDEVDDLWRNMYNTASLQNLTWYVALGNHDHQGNVEAQIELGRIEPRWILPHMWYDFTKDFADFDVHFVVFDTEQLNVDVNSTANIAFVNDTLRQSTADWKITVGHRPLYSTGNYGPISNRLDGTVRPLFEAYDVDVYMCGHDHNLQHIEQPDVGVNYLISGGGGAFLYFYDEDKTPILDAVGVKLRHFEEDWGFVGVKVTKQEMRFEFVGLEGNYVYNYTITK